MPKKIIQSSTLKEILEIEGTDKILAKYQTPCLSCPMASMEIEKLQIGQVAEMYGLDLKGILEDINKISKL